ncbi:MAG: pantoate--beta-alanine ligase [Flavobacteriales bacterium]|nr:pantoate--beta-alanine ligase [Flavobacteriales bacterium]
MQVLTSESELNSLLDEHRFPPHTTGFVPTMGALHEGHLSLVRKSLSENTITVCSIFVNPTQFNDPEDFNKYPRQRESDIEKLRSTGCQVLFCPEHKTIYPQEDHNKYNLGPVADKLEGSSRPGHFNGVASVVKRLLEIVNPTRAYFGLKDYQQFLVVHSLVKQYSIPVEIIGCETVRDKGGLAMSSRNERLSSYEKELATHLYKALKSAKDAVNQGRDSGLETLGQEYFNGLAEPELEYFKVADARTLAPIGDKKIGNDDSAIALIAARVGGVRLIDNMPLN